MENSNNWNAANTGGNQNQNWQEAENSDNQRNPTTYQSEPVDYRSAEANGYLENEDTDADESLYTPESDADQYEDIDSYDKDDEDDDEEDDDEEDDDDAASDWGTVDPQADGFPSDNDPSGPGSAV